MAATPRHAGTLNTTGIGSLVCSSIVGRMNLWSDDEQPVRSWSPAHQPISTSPTAFPRKTSAQKLRPYKLRYGRRRTHGIGDDHTRGTRTCLTTLTGYPGQGWSGLSHRSDLFTNPPRSRPLKAGF